MKSSWLRFLENEVVLRHSVLAPTVLVDDDGGDTRGVARVQTVRLRPHSATARTRSKAAWGTTSANSLLTPVGKSTGASCVRTGVPQMASAVRRRLTRSVPLLCADVARTVAGVPVVPTAAAYAPLTGTASGLPRAETAAEKDARLRQEKEAHEANQVRARAEPGEQPVCDGMPSWCAALRACPVVAVAPPGAEPRGDTPNPKLTRLTVTLHCSCA